MTIYILKISLVLIADYDQSAPKYCWLKNGHLFIGTNMPTEYIIRHFCFFLINFEYLKKKRVNCRK